VNGTLGAADFRMSMEEVSIKKSGKPDGGLYSGAALDLLGKES